MATILEARDDSNKYIFTDYERELTYKLRALLMDLPDDVFRSLNTLVEKSHGELWNDQVLLNYLHWALGMMNAEPLATNYSLNNFPTSWESVLLLGAEVMALFGQSILQNGHNFSYSDNGLSISLNSAGQYSSLASSLLSSFQSASKALKSYIRPNVSGVIGGGAGNVRIRSYSQKMWTYR